MKKKIIFFDTETTGLLLPVGANPDLQPHILELFALKTDHKCRPLSTLHYFFNPGDNVEIPGFITRLTGIDHFRVRNEKPFRSRLKKIKKFFKSADMIIAHNLTFDIGILQIEAARANKKFPFKQKKFCTIEQTMHITGYRLKLAELYKIKTGNENIKNAHTANADVYAMMECFKNELD